MTIPSSITYISKGELKYTYPFYASDRSQVKVKTGISVSTLALAVEDTDYTVSLNRNNQGGFVTFEEAPTEDHLVQIYSELPLQRFFTDFQDGGDPTMSRSEQLNEEFRLLYQMMDQVRQKLNQRIHIDVDHDGRSVILPEPGANRLLPWQWTTIGLGYFFRPVRVDTKRYNVLYPPLIVGEIVPITTKSFDYQTYDVMVGDIVKVDTKTFRFSEGIWTIVGFENVDTKRFTVTRPAVNIKADENVRVTTKTFTYLTVAANINQIERIAINTLVYDYTTVDPTLFFPDAVETDTKNYVFDMILPDIIPAFDDTSAYHFGAVVAEDSSGTNSWRNESSATSSDNTYATCVSQTWAYNGIGYGTLRNIIYARDFGISIPENATIQAIAALVEGKMGKGGFSSTTTMRLKSMLLMNGGRAWPGYTEQNVDSTLTTTDTEYGGPIYIPGLTPTLTPADVMSRNFGIGFRFGIHRSVSGNGNGSGPDIGFSVDAIRVLIVYTV